MEHVFITVLDAIKLDDLAVTEKCKLTVLLAFVDTNSTP